MANLVMIKPKPGSRKFKATKGMFNVHTVSEDGGNSTIEKNIGEFKGERFPKSRQMFRVAEWSFSKRRWKLYGFEEIKTDKKQDELNKLIAGCKLHYPSGHPKERQYIKEADIYDFNDPFFNHSKAKVIAQQGELILDKDLPLDNLIWRGMMLNTSFSTGSEINPITSPMVKYIIVDKTIDTTNRKRKRAREKEVLDVFYKLSTKKKKTVAMSLGLIPTEDVDEDVLDDILYAYAKSTDRMGDSNKTKQSMFLEVASLNTEDLNLKYIVRKAKSKGFLKRNRDQGWLLFGIPAGRTLEKVETYLNDQENQEQLIRLEEALKDGKGE